MGTESPGIRCHSDCEALFPASPPDGRTKSNVLCDPASKPGGFFPTSPAFKFRVKADAVWEGSETTTFPLDLWYIIADLISEETVTSADPDGPGTVTDPPLAPQKTMNAVSSCVSRIAEVDLSLTRTW